MIDSNFFEITKKMLEFIVDAIESQDIEGNIDIESTDDILYINTNSGTYVLNTHYAVREIWLVSPISGPYHFQYNQNKVWKTKSGIFLLDILTKELNIKFIYETSIS